MVASDRYKKFTLLHSNDMHGDFLAEAKDGDGTLIGGLAVLSGYLNEVRAAEKNVLYAIAGDMLQGSVIDSEYRGLSTFEIMNYLSPDVVTLGNHELDYGFRHLLFLEKMASFPFINANLYIKQYQRRIFRPYIVLERDGFSIMFIGVVTDEVLASLKLDKTISDLISLEEAAAEVGKVCNAYRNEDIDLTVLMTHIGFEQDKLLAELLDPHWGVDIIIGGHSHTVLEQPVEVNGILIAQAAVGTDQIGRFDFTIDDDTNAVVEWKWQLVPITEDLCEPDRDLERFIATFKDEIDRTYSRILSKLKRKLTHPQRETETEIGNLFADILLTAGRLDVVLLGSGSIRQPDLGPVVTLGDLCEIFTFDGPLYRVAITGERLLHVFAHAMRKENRVPGESNCFQVNHGVVAVYDDAAGRLVSLAIGGEPVDPAREYAVGLQDYTLSSCDTLLGLTTDELGPAKVITTSTRDVLNEFLTANPLADAVVEGRLVYQG